MATPETRRKTGPKPGVRQHRQRGAALAARVEQALDGTGADGRCRPIPEPEWAKLREAAWARWADYLVVRDWPSAKWRREGVMASPPDSAVHDGIAGRATRWTLTQPPGTGPDDPYDARPIITKLAEEGLEEVEDFKRQRPTAAQSIAGSLRTYTRILRDSGDIAYSRAPTDSTAQPHQLQLDRSF